MKNIFIPIFIIASSLSPIITSENDVSTNPKLNQKILIDGQFRSLRSIKSNLEKMLLPLVYVFVYDYIRRLKRIQ